MKYETDQGHSRIKCGTDINKNIYFIWFALNNVFLITTIGHTMFCISVVYDCNFIGCKYQHCNIVYELGITNYENKEHPAS